MPSNRNRKCQAFVWKDSKAKNHFLDYVPSQASIVKPRSTLLHVDKNHYLSCSSKPGQDDGIPSLRSLSFLVLIERLFTVAGGFLDAYSFLVRGHVSANAQTGTSLVSPCMPQQATGLMRLAVSGRSWPAFSA